MFIMLAFAPTLRDTTLPPLSGITMFIMLAFAKYISNIHNNVYYAGICTYTERYYFTWDRPSLSTYKYTTMFIMLAFAPTLRDTTLLGIGLH